MRTAAHALAEAQQDGTAPPFAGIRIKSFEAPTRARGVRTLTRFLATYAESRGSLDGFVVTLPKVTSTEQVGAFVHAASTIEDELGLADASVRFEVQVETPQSVLGPDGTALVARMVHAADGRLTGLHYGTYDYSAFCGIAAGQQSLEHPVADHAKLVMQAAAAGTGVRLSDGSTNVLPVGDGDAVHLAWAEPPPAGHPLAGARVLPGLGPAPGPPADAVRRDVRLLPWRPGPRARRGCAAYAEQRQDGTVADEPATARALADFVLRGLDCGAVDATEVRDGSGLDDADLRRLARRGRHGGSGAWRSSGREPVRQGGEPRRPDRARHRPPRDPRPQRQHRRCAATSTAAHVDGDQSAVLPTDTQKNTAFAYAKQHGVASPEDYALALGRRLLEATPAATAAQVRRRGVRLGPDQVDGVGHDHAFVRRGGEVRTCVVDVDRATASQVDSGLTGPGGAEVDGLGVQGLPASTSTPPCPRPTTGSWRPRSTARWRHDADAGRRVDWNASYDPVRDVLLATFATTYVAGAAGDALPMGSAVLDTHAGHRGGLVLGAQQAPLPGGLSARRSGSRTTARCSSPPTGRTA